MGFYLFSSQVFFSKVGSKTVKCSPLQLRVLENKFLSKSKGFLPIKVEFIMVRSVATETFYCSSCYDRGHGRALYGFDLKSSPLT